MITFSKQLKDKQKAYELSPSELAFADLTFIGYKDSDAYILSGLHQALDSDFKNKKAMTTLQSSEAFKTYIKVLTQKKNSEIRDAVKKEVRNDTSQPQQDAPLLDKESAIKQLESLLPDLEGKEKADVILKIADLRGWKKEQVKEEEELVKYHLPLGCNNCSLYIDAKKKGKG